MLNKAFGYEGFDSFEEDFKEVTEAKEEAGKLLTVRVFNLKAEQDTAEIIDYLREGRTIALIDSSAITEAYALKRVVDKLKKTTSAIDGDIAGLSDRLFVVTPTHVKVHRRTVLEAVPETPQQ